jgi:hypothetical protein
VRVTAVSTLILNVDMVDVVSPILRVESLLYLRRGLCVTMLCCLRILESIPYQAVWIYLVPRSKLISIVDQLPFVRNALLI